MMGLEVVSFLIVQENLFEAEVLQIAVKGAYQGQGIASALFAQLPADKKEIFLSQKSQTNERKHFSRKEKMAVIAEKSS